MAGLSVPRREARSTRVTVAVVLLAVASALVVGALVLREPALVGAAGVLAVAAGWTALRLAWNVLVDGRYQHAADRTELARAYRELFAERAVEQAEFVDSMATRLAQRDRVITTLRTDVTGLRGEVDRIRMRAVEAESSASAARSRLAGAHDHVAAMEALITQHLHLQDPTVFVDPAALPAPIASTAIPGAAPLTAGPLDGGAGAQRQRPPLLGRRRDRRSADAPAAASATVPEWAHLEPDPVDSLMAWEEHADRVSAEQAERGSSRPGRHAAG